DAVSEVFTFSTLSCALDSATDLPLTITAIPAVYSSEIEVPLEGIVESVRVSGLSGTHFRVSDLSARLISPEGTVVQLFANICGTNQDFNLSFSENGLEEIDCPPTSGLDYQPLESLSAFEGEEANGIWTLELEDSQTSAAGSFQNWNLEVCIDETIGVQNAGHYNLAIFPNPTSDMVNIDLGSESGIDLIQLYDVSGRQLESIKVGNTTRIEMDLKAYTSGVYYIRATGSQGSSAFKLIKEN